MYSLVEARLKCNRNIKINFKGGEISSDSGLLLVKEFANKIGLEQIAKAIFKTKDASSCRIHKDGENLMQEIYKTIAGYFRDDDSDELIHHFYGKDTPISKVGEELPSALAGIFAKCTSF